MHKFLSKFIVIAVIVNLFTGIIAISLSDTALAIELPAGPEEAQNEEWRGFCSTWASSHHFDVTPGTETDTPEGAEARAEWENRFQSCMNDPQQFAEAVKNDFDLNVILKEGKQFLPIATPELINFPEIPGTEGLDPAEGIPELIAFVYLIGLWLVGIAVFVQITGGGVRWLLSAGKPGEIEKAKSQITNAIFGLILLLSSYVILNTINPDLVNGVFETKPIGGGPTIPH